MAVHGAFGIAPVPGTPPVGTSATDLRLALGGIFGVTPQLVSGGSIALSGSNMNVTLGASVFQLADVTNAAATAFLGTDSTVLTPAAGPGTGNRTDIITIPLKNWENGDGVSQSQPTLVAGTAGSPGLVPSTPAGSYKYAQILVPTSAATASACTVTIFGNTTFASPPLNTPSASALALGSGVLNQKAFSAADSITYRWNGSAWKAWESDWIAYTPGTITGWTAGSGGTSSYAYRLDGGMVQVEFILVLGGAGLALSSPTFTLPLTPNASYPQYMYFGAGQASSNSSGGTIADLRMVMNAAASSVAVLAVNVGGTYSVLAGVTTTAPVTFATGGYLAGRFEYRPA